ncbi:MAG: sugar transferase [Bdellovibrionales bacterium]|nr:sugar transferase [Bdellovibrionales bacterium]
MILQLFDLTAMFGCLALSNLVSAKLSAESLGITSALEHFSISELAETRIPIQSVALALLFSMIWHAFFSYFKLYNSRRLTSMLDDTRQILKATTAGALVLLTADIASRFLSGGMSGPVLRDVYLSSVLFYVPVSFVTVTARLSLKFLLRQVRLYGRNLRYVVLVGTGTRAMKLAARFERAPELGYQLLGFADDGTGDSEFQASGYVLVSDLDGLPEYLRTTVIDEVIICLPIESRYPEISRIVADCARQGIMVRFLSEIFQSDAGYLRAEQYAEGAFISVSPAKVEVPRLLAKRALDFVGSLTLLFAFAPLFLLVAALVKGTSRGPVFFVQERLGYNKRLFPLVKFRTMQVGAEARLDELKAANEVDGPAFKMTNDPRVTTIGKFLRKTSIDELPQLLNVLMGDMSLVGPRPLPVRDYNGFEEDWHRRRFSVKPGLTCTWQISGRSDISFSDWMRMDIQYIDNWSLLLDLSILLGTIPAVVKGRGAR